MRCADRVGIYVKERRKAQTRFNAYATKFVEDAGLCHKQYLLQFATTEQNVPVPIVLAIVGV